MDNNGVFRRLCYILNFNNQQIISVFKLLGEDTTNEELGGWLKKEDDELFEQMLDQNLSVFLNGLIIYKRGKKEGEEPIVEKRLSNNLIFRKLRIAFNLKDQDVIDLLALVDFKLTKSELSAFFRSPTHSNYRECKDQLLRYFLKALSIRSVSKLE